VGPFNITKSGSYQLQGNFVTTNANRTAILVTADNVTIDLNGFTIMGPNVCTGWPLVCNNNGTGIGIDAQDRENIKVYNGTVRGMGNVGIRTGGGSVIESVRAVSNGHDGIYVNGNGTVSGNTVIGNGGNGIVVVHGTVSGNTVTGNRGDGIVMYTCTVSGNMVTANRGNGIYVVQGTVSGNTVIGNGLKGLWIESNTGYINNVLYNNTGGDVTGGKNLVNNLCSGALCPL